MTVDFSIVKRFLFVLLFSVILSAVTFCTAKISNPEPEKIHSQKNVTLTSELNDILEFKKELPVNEIWSCSEDINQAYLVTDLEKLNDLRRARLFTDNRFAILKSSSFSEIFYDFRCIRKFYVNRLC